MPEGERIQRESLPEGGDDVQKVLQRLHRQEGHEKGNLQQGHSRARQGPELQTVEQGAEAISQSESGKVG